MTDLVKARREAVRWLILLTLNAARPVGANELIIFTCVHDEQPDVTPHEVRREMDYLAERGLVTVTCRDCPSWFGKLTRDGIDVVEYTATCDAGIARPPKYWK